MAIACFSAPEGAGADSAGQVGVRHGQPVGVGFTWTDRGAMLFGGRDYHYDTYYGDPRIQEPTLRRTVARIDPDGSVSALRAKLPTGREGASAFWDGRYAYAVGGMTYQDSSSGNVIYSSEIVRVDPVDDTAEVVAHFGGGISGTVSVWDPASSSAFILYGTGVWRYRPGDAFVESAGRLPSPAYPSGAAAIGGTVYVVANTSYYGAARSILRFNPATGTATTSQAALAAGYSTAGVAGDGTFLYLLERPAVGSPRLLRYDPASDSLALLAPALPDSYGSGMMFDGSGLWMLGRPFVRYSLATGTATTVPAPVDWKGLAAPQLSGPAFDGTNLYALAADSSASGPATGRVVRMAPATGTITVTDAALDEPRIDAAGASDGRYVYWFGGYDPRTARYSAEILRFDPQGGELVSWGSLPSVTSTGAAFWDGARFIVLMDAPRVAGIAVTTHIVLYDPSSGSTEDTRQVFAFPRQRSSAFDGRYVYLFDHPRILRYDPVENRVAIMGARFPKFHYVASAAHDGRYVYAFGGGRDYFNVYEECTLGTHVCSRQIDEIWRYDPVADELTPMAASLPGETNNAMYGVWDGRAVDLVGTPEYVDDPAQRGIIRYRPTPAAPHIVSAGPGARAGEVSLSWRAPFVRTSGRPITGYRIWRDEGDGTDTLLADVGPATTATVAGLAPGGTTALRVSAVTTQGEGRRSLPRAGTALGAGAPQSPRAQSFVLDGRVEVAWDAPADPAGVTGYAIHRREPPYEEILAGTVGASARTFDDPAPEPNRRYLYRVRALTAAGGAFSAAAPSWPHTVPSAVWFTPQPRYPDGAVVVSWERPGDDGGLAVTMYRIWRGTRPGQLTVLDEVPASFGNYSDTNTPAGLYFYRVQAVNPLGEGAPWLEIPMAGTSEELIVGP